ncbi:MAG: hypothetical protein ACLUQ6_13150 [Alistipes onderdonkii]
MPVFQVIGNHDHNKAITVDADADASFEAAFGPTYYSYNIGDCHFIVLDDVLYTGSSSYTRRHHGRTDGMAGAGSEICPQGQAHHHRPAYRHFAPQPSHEPCRRLQGALRPARRL